VKYQDLVVKKTWEGQEKPKWLTVGTIRTTDDGKQFIELNLFPDTSIYVFDRKPREGQVQNQAPQQAPSVNLDNQEEIPF